MDPARKALEIYEKGFRALQHRDYAKAKEILSSLVTSYPEEKELHDRARVFLAVCERRAATGGAPPKSFEDRLCAATLALNRGDTAQALGLLTHLEREEPQNDHVHYLLAIAHGGVGQTDRGISHLRRAIELRPANRIQAGQDADLDTLRTDPGFHALVSGAQGR